MTGHPVHPTRWEAHAIETATLAILTGILEQRTTTPRRGTCPHCHALILTGAHCPICTATRRTHNGTAA